MVRCHVDSSGHVKTLKLTEGKVESLGGEVTDDVGSVTTPQGNDTLLSVDTSEAVGDTLVGGGETTLLDLRDK